MREKPIQEAGESRTAWLPGPIQRFFGRPHSVLTGVVLPARSGALSPASLQADYGVIVGTDIEIRAASIRGLSHRPDPGQIRQDSYAWSSAKDRLYVAVADGVGSALHSHIGAWTATRTAIELLSSGLGDPGTLGPVVAARISAIAGEMGVGPETLATTLTVALVRIGPQDLPWRVAIAEWGDSRASVFTPGKVVDGHPAWRRVTDEGRSMLANDVPALPFHKKATAWGNTMLAPGEVLVLATDGIDAHLRAENPVGHGLGHSWTQPPSIAQFICDIDFERVGARDDRTAVAVFRAAPEGDDDADEARPGRAGAGSVVDGETGARDLDPNVSGCVDGRGSGTGHVGDAGRRGADAAPRRVDRTRARAGTGGPR